MNTKKHGRYKPSHHPKPQTPRARPARYKPIKRHPIKQVTPEASVYTPRPGMNPIKPAKPPKTAPYKRLFFLSPPAPVPKAPFRHKYKKERHIDGVAVLLGLLAVAVAGVVVWLILTLI